jgi:hypothetical protein
MGKIHFQSMPKREDYGKEFSEGNRDYRFLDEGGIGVRRGMR